MNEKLYSNKVVKVTFIIYFCLYSLYILLTTMAAAGYFVNHQTILNPFTNMAWYDFIFLFIYLYCIFKFFRNKTRTIR